MTRSKKYYAVARGRRPGIYTQWFGTDGAQAQVLGFQNARYKGFASRDEAERFLKSGGLEPAAGPPKVKRCEPERPPALTEDGPRVEVYTDGGALGNPGPGGWAAVILDADPPTEIFGGCRHTTNNRMELTAAIMALRYFETPTAVRLHTDSRYVVDGITKGWARRWRDRGWMRNSREPAINADLWAALLDLCEVHDVHFVWVPGHAGVAYNERCDRLVRAMSARADLPPDKGYEEKRRLFDAY
ncbi:MAG: ribonuclease HI [Desulfobacteraceae bacterium]|jgi:ribonuclease HI|nr:ribonuclease HI [Desulfobacteraceae bacterium]